MRLFVNKPLFFLTSIVKFVEIHVHCVMIQSVPKILWSVPSITWIYYVQIFDPHTF